MTDYAHRKAERLAAIAKAAGAAQTKAYGRKKPRRRRKPAEPLKCGCVPESEEIRALVTWDNRTGSRFDLWWTRSEENESRRKRFADEAAARRSGWLRARGADNPGFPDLLCRAVPGLLVEMKAKCSKHGLTPAQREVFPRLRKDGWTIIIAHGADEAIAQLEQHRRK
jgi:hypothetical protein